MSEECKTVKKKLFLTIDSLQTTPRTPLSPNFETSLTATQNMFRTFKKINPISPLKTRRLDSRNAHMTSMRTSPRNRYIEQPTLRNINIPKSPTPAPSRLKTSKNLPIITYKSKSRNKNLTSLRTAVAQLHNFEKKQENRKDLAKIQIKKLEGLADASRDSANTNLQKWKIKYLMEGDQCFKDMAYEFGKFEEFDAAIQRSNAQKINTNPPPQESIPKPHSTVNKEELRSQIEKKVNEMCKAADSAYVSKKERRRRAIKKLTISLHFVIELMKAMERQGKTHDEAMETVRLAFPSQPFRSPESSDFFDCVKLNDLMHTQAYATHNRLLVFEYDTMGRTALHIAVHRGLFEMCELLLKFLADPNASDSLGRTPLYVASNIGSMALVKLLLRHKALPYLETKSNTSPITVAATKPIREILIQADKIYKRIAKIKHAGEREVIWKLEAARHFIG